MAEENQKTPEQIAAEAAEAEKKAAADKAKADKKAAAAEKPKSTGGAVVAVHKVVYGKDETAPAGSIIQAGKLTDKERRDLLDLGAVREPEGAELAVADAQAAGAVDDPLG